MTEVTFFARMLVADAYWLHVVPLAAGVLWICWRLTLEWCRLPDSPGPPTLYTRI